MPGRALVIGGSIAGLFAARFLRAAGWDATIFERNPAELASRGAGIVTHPELFELLDRAGVGHESEIGIPIERRRLIGPSGEIVLETRYPQIVTSWERLFRLLRADVPIGSYRLGKKLIGLEQSETGVTVHFADGTSEFGELLVAADGIWSTVRTILAPQERPAYSGYVAWRALVEEERLSPRTHATCFESFVFQLTDRSEILGYPVAGHGDIIERGKRRYNVVWYRPCDPETELRRLLTDDHGVYHDQSIPPPLIRADVIAELRVSAAQELAPPFAEIVQAAQHPFLQPIYDLALSRMTFGRVALLGDAAFLARPHVGAGVTKAAQDGFALVLALQAGGSLQQALDAFGHSRHPVGMAVVNRARAMGASLERRAEALRSGQIAHLDQDVHAVLRDTATLDFLRTRSAPAEG